MSTYLPYGSIATTYYTLTEAPEEVSFKVVLEPHDHRKLHEGRGRVYSDGADIVVEHNSVIFILPKEKITDIGLYRLSLAFRVNGMEIIIKDYGKAKELRDALSRI
ncbi:MAG: hypothetical protein AB1779_08980 [Candidatus Thermoplasmatota archaeon]